MLQLFCVMPLVLSFLTLLTGEHNEQCRGDEFIFKPPPIGCSGESNDNVECAAIPICGFGAEQDKEIETRTISGLWKIALPAALLPRVIPWYHFFLGHGGVNCLYDMIRDRFRAPGLRRTYEEYKCTSCQMNRQPGPIYGEDIKFNALTNIDLVSNSAEIVRIDNKTAEHVAQKFENLWLV
eukprot:8650137-Ditylum_brightwellii.AAC.1